MKWLYVFVAICVAVNAEEYCKDDVASGCKGFRDDLQNCNAIYSGFTSNVQHLQAYANEQLAKSFDYLLLAANFGTHVKNRPGFEKQFRALSDAAWGRTIGLIKHITKRGGEHNFAARRDATVSTQQDRTLELNEIDSLALALDVEKQLALEAHHLHYRYSHGTHRANEATIGGKFKKEAISSEHKATHYDAEVAHYLEEEFIEDQASTVRKLSGYTNDLKRLIQDSTDTSLSVYLFDEYLQKQ